MGEFLQGVEELEPLLCLSGYVGQTCRTLEKNLPKKGRYLITVRGHVLAAVDGKVHDWSSGRLHRINKVYKISF